MDILLLLGLAILALPLVLPLIAWFSARKSKHRLDELERIVERQSFEMAQLSEAVQALTRRERRGTGGPAVETPPVAQQVQVAHEPASEVPLPGRVEPAPVSLEEERVVPVKRPEIVTEQPAPEIEQPAIEIEQPAIAMDKDEEVPQVERAGPQAEEPQQMPPVADVAPLRPAFDWESLVGVKLFSAVAGISLVLAAVFFLRYSIESGWLQPPVRVTIGVIVAVGLLIVCERKAARRYPVTANALDAAAVAILFSTFFSAHALWNLIPATVTFALLALVTAVAVLLSIRRESLFIAVLGLLGGFATPALLSTGENRPIPLFAYLLLLNIGLAWVAYRRRWSSLTWLSLALTTIYQWGWVFRFLEAGSVSLAMGIFIIFPLAGLTALILASRPGEGDAGVSGRSFERSALVSAAVPMLFATYLAAVPEYATRPGLLFGFVLLIDLGLFAVTLARREELLHAAGAAGTMLTMAIWMAVSYDGETGVLVAPAFAAIFALLYLFAPDVARRVDRPLSGTARWASFTAPLILFVFPVLAAIEPAFENPVLLFAILIALTLLIAWRAIRGNRGGLYYTAAFFAVAAQATWSATHLSPERLGTAVAIYTVFGLVSLAVPMIARRMGQPLQPAWGSGAVLLASIALLLFVSAGSVAPQALWALALLLAILNAALFIESAAGTLPLISQAGSLLSWVVLGTWWIRAAASVGVIPSLAVLTGLSLVTLAGHAWSTRLAGPAQHEPRDLRFGNGLYLGLIGHLFLVFLSLNPGWAVPPWPIFGSLVVITLATSAASLYAHASSLHAGGVIMAAFVVLAWSWAASDPPNGTIALATAAAISAYAISWLRIGAKSGYEVAAKAAAAVLFIGEASAIATVGAGGAPPFVALVMAHAINLSAILWLTSAQGWRTIAPLAVAPAWLAVWQWHEHIDLETHWPQLLVFVSVLYAVFVAYPLVLGRRVARDRDPHLAAVVASAMCFFTARQAFLAGNLEWMIGIVPVIQGGVLAFLLRSLMTIEPAGERDIGRLALVAGAALAFVTVAIPMQLDHQWITIGWALEGAALAWLYRRVPHRGLLYASCVLLAAVFVRLALNPEVLLYEPRGSLRIFNWYLYTYVTCAGAMFLAAWWLSKIDDRVLPVLPRVSHVLPACGVVLLFILLNIEIADYFATGPTIAFRFGVTVSQDLTYTIGWLVFGMGLLTAGIALKNRIARTAAVALIAVTTCKCFLYDLGSLGGLYRVASLVGLAMSLSLVALALQKFVLARPRGNA